MQGNLKAISGTVQGRVQGVGFRYFVLDAAQELGIYGWVRNAENRKVEFFAQGGEAELDAFRNKLLKGPPLSRVERLLADMAEPDGTMEEFEIRS